MSIKKSLLALAVAALTSMVFASAAMAEGGKLIDVTTGKVPTEGRELHLVGWMKVETEIASVECHVTAVLVATGLAGRTGHIKTFTVPDTSKCKLEGALSGCKFKKHEATTTNGANEIWDVTTTKQDFALTSSTGSLVIHNQFEGLFCPTEITLTIEESVTLRPLKTGTSEVTGTFGNLSKAGTAASGESIAGLEFSVPKSAKSTVHVKGPIVEGTEEAVVTSELELTDADRCTWKIVEG
jgi:hypothetical protein